jgi:hypothetical protein
VVSADVPPTALATLLAAAGNGLLLHALLDPQVDITEAITALQTLLTTVINSKDTGKRAAVLDRAGDSRPSRTRSPVHDRSRPGYVIAFDLHTWHASFGGRDRLAWTIVYQRRPDSDEERQRTLRSMADSFEQAFRGFDRHRYPIWRDWLAGAEERHPRRAQVAERLRVEGELDLAGAGIGWRPTPAESRPRAG